MRDTKIVRIFVGDMRVRQAFTDRKDAVMDLKKRLLDLADTIRYWDMYDLTEVPNVLKAASEKIGELELELMKLQDALDANELGLIYLEKKLEEQEIQPRSHATNKVELYPTEKEVLKPVSDRAELKRKLDELGVKWDPRDNTPRLRKKLQRALRKE